MSERAIVTEDIGGQLATGTGAAEAVSHRPPGRPRLKALFVRVLAVVLMLLAWQLASWFLSEQFVPGPVSTFSELYTLAQAGELQEHFIATMNRVLIGFALAMVCGIVLGTIMGMSRIAEQLLDVGVVVTLTIPSLVYIIVAFMWFGLSETGSILAVAAATIPAITINVWSGVKAIDHGLLDMAKVFKTAPMRRTLLVVIPQVLPYVMAASRFGLGLVWKIVVFVELLGRPDGVGFMLNYSYQVFNMPAVFAWTLFFVVIMLAIELGILRPIEQRLFRWRPTNKS
jgi:NitT/TauT family transport system permease protein